MEAAMNKQRGFSIIELAVTLVVLGLLMTSAIPSISDWLRNTRIRNQAEGLLNGLQKARNEAVRGNRTMTFWMVNLPTSNAMNNSCALSATGTSWVVSSSDPAGKCGEATGSDDFPGTVATNVGADGGNGVSVSGLQTNGSAASSVTFDGFGRATSATSLRSIDISYATSSSGDRPLRIEISNAGLTRLCDPAVTTSGDPRKCSATSFQ
jgi:type IV fimbrial biogenesis protein FimT